MSDKKLQIVKVPLLDTGIGQEAGYANDQEFIKAMETERQAMDPDVREALDRLQAYLDGAFLGGEDNER